MNCANHPQNAVAAYCRTCGKPLCTNCTRPVMGVIYCEQCLADRVAGTAPQNPYQTSAGFQPGAVPPAGPHIPNPGLAGFLGAIPFGVGAIYNGQYTKGLVHLGVFVALVVALSSGNLPGYMYPVLGIFMGFFVLYQIIDAVKTAKAIQANEPPPDPFGLANMFSPSGRAEAPPRDFSAYRNVPAGAIVLIVLGILFLLHNLGLWFLRMDVLWPLILIGLGVWLLAKRLGSPGGLSACGHRGLMGPAVLITLGVQFLLSNLEVISFGRTLPVLLIVIGVILAIQRSSSHPPGVPAGATTGPSGSEIPPADVVPPSEVKNG